MDAGEKPRLWNFHKSSKGRNGGGDPSTLAEHHGGSFDEEFVNLASSSAIMVNSNSRKEGRDQKSASSSTSLQVGLVIALPCPHRRILGGGSDDDFGEKDGWKDDRTGQRLEYFIGVSESSRKEAR